MTISVGFSRVSSKVVRTSFSSAWWWRETEILNYFSGTSYFVWKCQLQVLSQVKHEILQPQWFIENSVTRAYHAKFSRCSPFFSSRFSRMRTPLGPKWDSKWFSVWVFVLGREFGGFHAVVFQRTERAIVLIIFCFVLIPPCWSLLNKIKPFRISLLWFIGNQTRFVVV